MKAEIIDFNTKYLKEAAALLQTAQIKQFDKIGYPYKASLELCEKQIVTELNKEVSSSHVLLLNGRVVGFAIATIKKDSIWGDSGWVNIGAWSIEPEYMSYFPYLYQKIAETWVNMNISQHYFLIFDHDKSGIDILNDMGFAKQQTHAVLDLSSFHEPQDVSSPYVYRRSTENDQAEMNGFSRLIAEYQSRSPCFASSPPEYLEALDEGFSDITADPEIDLFVVQDGDVLAGYQGYYDAEEADLMIPPKSVELAVSGVKEDYRGEGCGLKLTFTGLSAQKQTGFEYAVTDWRCANLLSGTFWKKIGFIPVAHRLLRQIDPLI